MLPELAELERDQATYEKRMVECHVLGQKAEQHTEQLTDRYNSLVISSLRTRDANVLQIFRQLSAQYQSVWRTLQSGLRSVFSGSFWSFRHNSAAAMILLVGILVALLVRHRLPKTLPARADDDISYRFKPAALLTLRRHALMLLPLVMVALFIFMTGPTIRNLPLPVVLCYLPGWRRRYTSFSYCCDHRHRRSRSCPSGPRLQWPCAGALTCWRC